MRRADATEERSVQASMRRHGVVVRDVWVRPGVEVNAWAPLRGRMWVSEGFLTAPTWRRAAILAHEAGHARLRHVSWCLVLVVVTEAALIPARMALGTVALASPLGWGLSMALVGAAQVGVFAGLSALGRRQEFAADRWAVQHGGITVGVYRDHLALLHHPEARGLEDRALATHPSPDRRIKHLRPRKGAAAVFRGKAVV